MTWARVGRALMFAVTVVYFAAAMLTAAVMGVIVVAALRG